MLCVRRLLLHMVSYSVFLCSVDQLLTLIGLYNAFLAPGSPCELNIDHALRNSLAGRMTKAVGDDESMLKSLQEVEQLFEMAQTSVFKLMSSVRSLWLIIQCEPITDYTRTPSPSSFAIRSTPASSRNTISTLVSHDHTRPLSHRSQSAPPANLHDRDADNKLN